MKQVWKVLVGVVMAAALAGCNLGAATEEALTSCRTTTQEQHDELKALREELRASQAALQEGNERRHGLEMKVAMLEAELARKPTQVVVRQPVEKPAEKEPAQVETARRPPQMVSPLPGAQRLRRK